MSNSARNKYNQNQQSKKNGKIPFIGALRPIELIGIGLLLLAILLYGLSRNSSKKTPKKADIAEIDSSGQNSNSRNDDSKDDILRRRLYVAMDSLRFRKGPDKDSSTLKYLQYGEELIDMGEYENEQTIRLTPDYSVTEPWIKVKTKEGRTGWVYGAGVRPYPKKRPEPKKENTETPSKDNTNNNTNSK